MRIILHRAQLPMLFIVFSHIQNCNFTFKKYNHIKKNISEIKMDTLFNGS